MTFVGNFGIAVPTTASRPVTPGRELPGVSDAALSAKMWTPALTRLAELSARLPRRHGHSIEVLLAAARPFDDGFEPLRPLWAHEAVHRAVGMLRLFAVLHRRDRSRPSPHALHERRLALHLTAELASLETRAVLNVLPCSGPLREVARDLVGLFGPAVGEVVLDTDVALLSLPAYRRRALVLLGSELVTNALSYAFSGRSMGHISLRLQRLDAGHARLQLADDGVGYVRGQPDPVTSVAGALTDLLEGEIRYCGPPGRGSMAEVIFPIDS